jgi:hypothetical protein
VTYKIRRSAPPAARQWHKERKTDIVRAPFNEGESDGAADSPERSRRPPWHARPALSATALPVRAEMLEFATPQGPKSWPKLPTLTDWHQDTEVSQSRGVNFLVPDGADTPTAEVTISAEGVSRQTGPTDVSALVERDKAAAPGAEVKQLAAVRDKDGTPSSSMSSHRPTAMATGMSSPIPRKAIICWPSG